MRTSRTFPVAIAVMVATGLAAAACGGGGADRGDGNQRLGSVIRCADPSDSVLYKAVAAYVRQLEPRPVRFVMAYSGSEALPGPARAAMQQIGPTFIWPEDAAGQQKMRDMLKQRGEYTTMLLTFKGMERTGRDEVVVRFGGRYVGTDMDGREAPLGAVHFNCDRAQWVLDTARVGKSA
jgi:hypothetical protein